jgi:hypothetical protein
VTVSAAGWPSTSRSDDGQTISRAVPTADDTSYELHVLVGMAGFESAASCSQIRSSGSLHVAPCRQACRSLGKMLAGRRQASPDVCACWLPLWLPPALYRASISVRRTENLVHKRNQGTPIAMTRPVKITDVDVWRRDVAVLCLRSQDSPRGATGTTNNARMCASSACSASW